MPHHRDSGRHSGRKSPRKSGRKTAIKAEEEYRKTKREAALLMERRVLISVTGISCLAFVIWLVALCTNYWIIVINSKANADSSNGIKDRASLFSRSHSGLWSICFQGASKSDNQTSDESMYECSYHVLDPGHQELRFDPVVAKTIIDYRRTVMALAVLSVLIMAMAVTFSLYTFQNLRYTFKRLASAIHFLTAACVLVLIEVVSGGAAYSRLNLPLLHPKDSTWHYGYSFFLAWLVFFHYAIAGVTFLFYSRKKKGDKALTDDMAMIDEPQIFGR